MRFEEFIAFERKDERRNTKIQDILELLEDYGEIPDTLKEELQRTDSQTLKTYLKLAAKANSIEEFTEMIE